MDTYRQQGSGQYTGGSDTNDKINFDLMGRQTSQLNLLQNFTLRLNDDHVFRFKNFLLQTGTSTNTERIGYLHGQHHFGNDVKCLDGYCKFKKLVVFRIATGHNWLLFGCQPGITPCETNH